jgi:hypothetical protein
VSGEKRLRVKGSTGVDKEEQHPKAIISVFDVDFDATTLRRYDGFT